MSENLKVTSIEELKKVALGELVELPGFTKDSSFVARLKRPSMLAMTKSGKIPNELLVEANKLFVSGTAAVATQNQMDEKMMNDLFSILEIICQESFVEPSYKELREAGIELTDEQQMFVFAYAQRGVEALKSFRQ
jgi:hypothetical protein